MAKGGVGCGSGRREPAGGWRWQCAALAALVSLPLLVILARRNTAPQLLLALAADSMGVLLGGGQPAQAQTAELLVVTRSVEGDTYLSATGTAGVKFTTGSSPVTLSHVSLIVASGNANTVVSIRDGSGEDPGARVVTLTNPATFANNNLNAFTAPANTVLKANTTYFLVLNDGVTNASHQASFSFTSVNTHRGRNGWRIADTLRSFNGSFWTSASLRPPLRDLRQLHRPRQTHRLQGGAGTVQRAGHPLLGQSPQQQHQQMGIQNKGPRHMAILDKSPRQRCHHNELHGERPRQRQVLLLQGARQGRVDRRPRIEPVERHPCGRGPATTSFTVWNLTNDLPYSFHIRAFADKMGSPAEVRATPSAAANAPAKPTGLKAAAGPYRNQVSLQWDDPDPANSAISKWQYRQKTGTGSYGAWTDIPNSTAATTSHTVTGLASGTQYAYRIRALVGTAAGVPSDEAKVTAAATIPAPAKPTGVRAVLRSSSSADLVWDDPGNPAITKYEYRIKVGTGDYSAWQNLIHTGRSAPFVQLSTGVRYSLVIRAVVGTVAGPASDEATVTAGVDPVVPSAPSGLVATPGPLAEQATLSWDNPNNSIITGYEYRIRTLTGANWATGWLALSGSGKESVSSVFTNPVLGGGPWKIQLRVVAGSTKGDASAVVTLTPATTAVTPAAPTGFTVTPGPEEATLSWDNPNNPILTGYQYRQGSGAWTNIPNSNRNTVSHTVSGLTGGAQYSFSIRAVAGENRGIDSRRYSPATAAVSVTPGSALTAPSGLTPAPGPKAGEATLQWDNPNNSIITGYEYRIRIWDVQNDGQWIGGWSAYGGTDHTTVSIVFSGLRVNTFYEVQLRAVAGTVKGHWQQ